jgi:hypothetical protein
MSLTHAMYLTSRLASRGDVVMSLHDSVLVFLQHAAITIIYLSHTLPPNVTTATNASTHNFRILL